MTEYADTSPGIAIVALLLLPTLVIASTAASLVSLRRVGQTRRRWRLAVMGGLLGLIVFAIMLWAPVVPQETGVDLYCDQAFRAITRNGSSGNAVPQWAVMCRSAAGEHLVAGAGLTVAWLAWCLVQTVRGRRR